MPSESEAWRTLTRGERKQIAANIGRSVAKRLETGLMTYGKTLEGDVEEHLETELLDALIYHQWAKRKIASQSFELHDRASLERRLAALG